MVIFTRGLKLFKQLITRYNYFIKCIAFNKIIISIAMLMISRSEIIAFADDSYDQ